MEYVDGEAITSALDRAGAERERRLAAFLAVCAAVAFAHRELVVHADIKPANVLMRADGAVKLLDFGIARLIEEIEPDEDATPLSADPRLCRAGAGAAAARRPSTGDIYSLGVLLDELLRGAGSRRRSGRDRRAGAARPIPPTAIRTFRRWSPTSAPISTISRSRRGRRSARRYRAGKFLRRHRIGALVTAAIILLLGAAAITSTIPLCPRRAGAGRGRAALHGGARAVPLHAVRSLRRSRRFARHPAQPASASPRRRAAIWSSCSRCPTRRSISSSTSRAAGGGWRRWRDCRASPASAGRNGRGRRSIGAEAQVRAILAANPANAGALAEAGWVDPRPLDAARQRAESDGGHHGARPACSRRALRREPGLPEARLGLLTARRNRGYDLIWSNRPRDARPILRAALGDLRRQRFAGQLERDARRWKSTC